MKIMSYFIICINILAIFGCQNRNYVTHQPDEKYLVGFWKLDDNSRNLIQKYQNAKIGNDSLILTRDGNFEANNYPYLNRTQLSIDMISGNGKWELIKQDRVWQIELIFIQGHSETGSTLSIGRDEHGFFLHKPIKNPDGPTMKFYSS